MRLDCSHGAGSSAASSAEVEAALRTLADADAFVILARDPENYVQATAGVLEYRADGEQFRAAEPVDAALRANVFRAYLRGDPGFNRLCRWESAPEHVPRRGQSGWGLMIALALCGAAAALIWWRW